MPADREETLARIQTAVLAAFPDRADAILTELERRFGRPIGDPGSHDCVFCKRAPYRVWPIVGGHGIPDEWRQSLARELGGEFHDALPREEIALAGVLFVCLECSHTAARWVRDPRSGTELERVDVARALRSGGCEDLVETVERVWGGAKGPMRCQGIRCALDGKPAAISPADGGEAYCEDCILLLHRRLSIDWLSNSGFPPVAWDRIDTLLRRVSRGAPPFVCAVANLDGLMSYNDEHGHVFGDRMIAVTGRTLIPPQLRPGDELYRISGDEFLVVFPASTLAAAAETAESIRARVEAEPLPTAHGRKLTISLGLVEAKPGMDRESLQLALDDRLLQAKRLGRNRVSS